MDAYVLFRSVIKRSSVWRFNCESSRIEAARDRKRCADRMSEMLRECNDAGTDFCSWGPIFRKSERAESLDS